MLRFIDGFDHYTTITAKWDSGSADTTTEQHRNGTRSVRFIANSISKNFFPAFGSWVIGFGLYGNTTAPLITLYDGVTAQCTLNLNSDKTLEVSRGTSTSLGASAKSALTIGNSKWYYIEWKVTIADSILADSCKVRVNGSDWINVNAGSDTKAGTVTTANKITFSGGSQYSYMDDIYILDGVAPNNDFLGDVKVETLYPSSNAGTNEWLGSDGQYVNNYQLVSEATANTTNYVQSGSIGAIEMYNFQDLESNALNVYGVQINSVAIKDDAGTVTFKNRINSGGTVSEGVENTPVDGSYLIFSDRYDLNPNGNTAWTTEAINALQAGVIIQQGV